LYASIPCWDGQCVPPQKQVDQSCESVLGSAQQFQLLCMHEALAAAITLFLDLQAELVVTNCY